MARTVQDAPVLAASVLVGTVLALSFGDALVRKMGLSADIQMSLWQIFLLRSGMAMAVLIAVAVWRGAVQDLQPDRWTLLRSGMLVTMWLLYYEALLHLPFSVGAAAYYTLPLFILVFSAVLTKDRIGGLGVSGVVLGFLGVLVITDPRNGINLWLILPLCAAMLYALSMILTRTRCGDASVLRLAFWLNAVFVVVGTLGVLVLPDGPRGLWQMTWVPMTAAMWGSIGISAAAILIGSLGTAYAYQRASGPLLGTFDFSYLAFAVLWGWLLFDERINGQTALGIGLIVAAGALALASQKRTAGPAQASEA